MLLQQIFIRHIAGSNSFIREGGPSKGPEEFLILVVKIISRERTSKLTPLRAKICLSKEIIKVPLTWAKGTVQLPEPAPPPVPIRHHQYRHC